MREQIFQLIPKAQNDHCRSALQARRNLSSNQEPETSMVGAHRVREGSGNYPRKQSQ